MNKRDIIREYLKKNKERLSNKKNSEIAREAIQNSKEIYNLYYGREETLRVLVSSILKEEDSVKINTQNQPKEIKTPYKVVGDKHVFSPLKGEFSISNELVDKLFYSFSKHGLDLSQTQIINKYNLEPWQWHAIKNALKLYKLSNIFSPHTIEITDPEVMKEMVREKLNQKVNTLGYTVEKEHENVWIKKYKEVVKKQTKKDLTIQTFMTEIQDLLPQVNLESSQNKRCKTFKTEEGEIVVVIADIHFGLNNSNSDDLPDYSVSKTKEILSQIVDEVNTYHSSGVHVINLGDIIETFQGNNHVGSWKGIETGYYGSRLVIECYKLFVEFLSRINNLKSYNQLPGNHDRSSSDNKEDVEGFISRIVFEFIKNSFINSGIDFYYEDIVLSKEIGNINYIATHGHLPISKMPASELILEYSKDPKKFTILLQGHLHSRQVKREHKMFRDLIVPAIMPGNNYSVTHGYSGTAGYLIIKEKSGKPTVIDYTI